jgi:hypothetical protein
MGTHVLTLAQQETRPSCWGQLSEDSASRERDADPQEANVLERTERVSRSLAKTRRDQSQTPRERRINGVEDCDPVEVHYRNQAGGRWSSFKAHSPLSFSLQARIGGNALGSQPDPVRVPLQLPGNRSHLPDGVTGLGSER